MKFDPQCVEHSEQCTERRVSDTVLDAGDELARDPCLLCDLLLSEAEFVAAIVNQSDDV
jgi:hypothetical protein